MKKINKTWISLLTVMHKASKDPHGLSWPTFAASFLLTPHLTLYTVATTTFSYFLKSNSWGHRIVAYSVSPEDSPAFFHPR